MKKLFLASVATFALSSALIANQSFGTVNGEEITKSDIQMVIKDPKVNFAALPKDTQDKVINQVVDTKLLAQNALKSGITNEKVFQDTLTKLKNDLALEFWMQKQAQTIEVTEAAMKKFYDANKDKFTQKAKLKARHILVASEDEAKTLIAELNKAKNIQEAFIKLAKEKSTGPSGVNGGDLGWFEAKQMVPEFSKAASNLNKGAITNSPVKTQFGYHVIYLEDKKDEGVASFADSKDKIKQVVGQELFLKKVRTVVEDLRKKSEIKLNK